jgi:hypothetical protein
MIDKKEFINFIESYETFENGINRITETLSGGKPYTIDLWGCAWVDAVCKMWDNFMYSHFTEEGYDLINWWKFEDVDHIITQKVDPDLFHGRSEIEYNVNDIEDLWNYLIKFKLDYFKQDLNCKSDV